MTLNITINSAVARDIYSRQLAEYRNSRKGVRLRVLLWYGWLVAGPILFLIFVGAIGIDLAEVSWLVILCLAQTAVGVGAMIAAHHRVTAHKRLPRRTGVSRLDLCTVPSFAREVEFVMGRAGLSSRPMQWWIAHSPNAALSITEDGETVHILVTSGVLAVESRFTGAVRGMLAHEAAHIVHADTEVLVWSESVARTMLKALFGSWGVGLAIFVIRFMSGSFEDLNIWSAANTTFDPKGMLITIVAKSNLEKIAQSRMQAEVLADTYALLLVGAVPMYQALRAISPPDGAQPKEATRLDLFGDYHPSLTFRKVMVAAVAKADPNICDAGPLEAEPDILSFVADLPSGVEGVLTLQSVASRF